ncbi:MAG: hypothetical protein AAGF60_10760 [Pseudomonadota bacterium]
MSMPSQIFVYDPGVAERHALELSDFELAFLSVARSFFETFESPSGQCWMMGFMDAERRFPIPYGATIAHAISMVVSELRESHQGVFPYFRTTDELAGQAVTQTERYLLETLRHIRNGNRSGAQTTAMLLCQGNASRGLLQALERLCLITGDVTELRF